MFCSIADNIEQIVTKLIRYVIVMPKIEEGEDRCYKLPYVSSEMLAIQSEIFYEQFFNKKQEPNQAGPKEGTKFLDMLFGFLRTDAVDNQLLLGYFQKVVNNLQKGRRLQLSKYISNNLPTFTSCLHLQTIGSLLTSSIILLNQKQGIIQSQRKKIVSQLVHNLIKPSTTDVSKIEEVREICGDAIVQILAKHKTFSSGDQIVEYLWNCCGELLVVYSFLDMPVIVRFLAGIMKASLMKIYNPELDTKQNIFKLPETHRNLLVGYLPLRLHQLTSTPRPPQCKLRQQNGSMITKIEGEVLDFLTLLALTLQNQIDQFLIEDEESTQTQTQTYTIQKSDQNFQLFMDFVWSTMRRHPKNDIALVQIVRIVMYICGKGCEKSKNKTKLRNLICKQWNIVGKFCQLWKNQEQKLLRPHLFQIWNQLRTWISEQYVSNYPQWKSLCSKYQQLIPLHSKAAGLNYNRPTAIKLVIDEQDQSQQQKPAPMAQNGVVGWRLSQNSNPESHETTETTQAAETQNPQNMAASTEQAASQFGSGSGELKIQSFSQQNTFGKQKKQYQITEEMAKWMDGNQKNGDQSKQIDKQDQANLSHNQSGFQEFDEFFTNDKQNEDKQAKKVDDFSGFDSFL